MEMLRTRPVAVILLALSPMAVSPAAVSANGGSFFRFERKYFAPGEVVTAQTTFSTEVEKSGRIEDGPYHAFLLSSDRWIQPPKVPNDAIPIGYITTSSASSGAATARITFTVPQIEPGPYTLTLCNLPCTHATLGDLAGGWLSIASTKDEALRKEITDRINSRILQVRQNLAARIRDTVNQRNFATQTEVQRLADHVTKLEAQLVRMQNREPENASGDQHVPWTIAGLALLFAILMRRRRFPGSLPKQPKPRIDTRPQIIPMFSDAPQEAPGVDHQSEQEFDPARL
jgi:hypothetical protein